MFVVLEAFADLQDNGYRYKSGDFFPREGASVSKARLDALASDKNRQKRALIKEVVEKAKTDEMPKIIEEEVEKKPEQKKKRRTKSEE